jgi:hypothetical protein
MGVITSIGRQFRPPTTHTEPVQFAPELAQSIAQGTAAEKDDVEFDTIQKPTYHRDIESGVARVEAAQAVWGKNGKWILVAG